MWGVDSGVQNTITDICILLHDVIMNALHNTACQLS